MRRLIVLPLLAALAVPAVAEARSYIVRGGGWGHGVGMSQYGAYGLAQHGSGYREILSHYYRGTRLDQVAGRKVRVLLQASAPEPASFSNGKSADGRRLDPTKTYAVRARRSGKLVVRVKGGGRVGAFSAPLRITGRRSRVKLGGPALNGVRGGRYRGRMEFRPGASGGITAINIVGLDDYVRGVIPAEMPASWHAEALKAQAVAARSYALATDAGGAVFDHYPDTRSQVYRGIRSEERSTTEAVRATARQALHYAGDVATTFFFSTSGGHTEHVQNVFGGSRVRYLRGVPDPYDDISPLHRWRLRLTRRQMDARLDAPGRFRRVKVLERGASPRIIRARVVGSAGSIVVSGATLRARLGTYDMPWSIKRLRAGATATTSSELSTSAAGAAVGQSEPFEKPPKG